MFNAFISYSHDSDDKFAPALQKALQNFAKPWYKKRNLEIFRDESSLSVSPHLWDNITKALDESEYLILLASPLSEKSEWVNKEVEYWLEHKSIETILIALTEGEMIWDNANNCYQNPDNNSLPPALDNVFELEPFYIDLRQSKTEEDLSLNNPIFNKEILKVAAKLHNKTPNDLASEEVTVHRKMMLVRNLAIGALSILFLTATVLGIFADKKRNEAEIETKKAQNLTFASIAGEQLYKNPTIAIRLAELAFQKSLSGATIPKRQKLLLNAFSESVQSKQLFYSDNLWHESEVVDAEYSLDGRKVFTMFNGIDYRFNKLGVWNLTTGKVVTDSSYLKAFRDAFPKRGFLDKDVEISKISKSNKLLLTSSLSRIAIIWDFETGTVIHELEDPNGVITSGFFSKDDKYLLTFSGAEDIIIWDVSSGELLVSLQGQFPKFSPDGKKLLTLLNDGQSYIYGILDIASAEWLYKLGTINHPIGLIGMRYPLAEFSPDGKKLVKFSNDSIAQIWNVESERLELELIGHEDLVVSSVFSQDGAQIVTTSNDGTAKIWDSETGKLLKNLKGHKGAVIDASFSKDGRLLVTASADNSAKIWDINTGELEFNLIGHKSWVNSAIFSKDAKQVITTSNDRTCKIWNITSGNPQAYSINQKKKVKSIEFSTNGELLLTHSYDETLTIWDLENGRKTVLDKLDGKVGLATFSADNKYVVTSYYESIDTDVKVWNATTGNFIHNLGDQTIHVSWVSFSPNGKYIVTSNAEGYIMMWDLASGEHLYDLQFANYEHVFSADSKRLFINTSGGLNTIDAKSGVLIDSVYQENSTGELALSPNGNFLATTNSDGSRLWDVSSGKPQFIKDIKFTSDALYGVNFSHDGKWLSTISNYNSTMIWKVDSGNQNPIREITGNSVVTSAAFSPDDKLIMTIHEDDKVIIWDFKTGELIDEFIGTYVSFSADGKKMGLISENGKVKIFRTTQGILNWLNASNIYAITQKDLEDLGIDFIDLALFNK